MITNHKKPYNAEWVRCPVCGAKTRDRIREDTILKNYPLYCPKFKQETGPRSILWTKKVESAGHEKKGRRHCESTASTLGHFVSKVHSNA